MGATEFTHVAFGKTAEEAFSEAIANAQWESGHGGYTGTIAEKGSFVLFAVPTRALDRVINGLSGYWEGCTMEDGLLKPSKEHWPKGFPAKYKPLVRRMYNTYDDKWGPAVCVQLQGKAEEPYLARKRSLRKRGLKTFYFCGLASS